VNWLRSLPEGRLQPKMAALQDLNDGLLEAAGFADYFDPNSNDAGLDHVDFTRGGEREIDDSAVDEWSAIGDADIDAFLILEIGHLDPGIEGKRAMRGGQLFHVENFSVRRAPAVVRDSVPTGDSSFRCADPRGLHG